MSRINWPSFPLSWAETQLGQVAQIVMGQSPPGHTYNKEGQGLPFFQGKTDFGEIAPTPASWCTEPSRIAEAGDILISVRAPVGPTNLAPEKSCIGRGLAAIRPDPKYIDRDFLLYYLRFIEPALVSQGQGSTFEAINKSDLYGLRVLVPPLAEQKRIVEILKQADALRRQRREILEQAKQLPAALFLEMFGDPSKGKKRYSRFPLGKLCKIIGGGTPSKLRSEYWNGSIPWVSPKDMKDTVIRDAEDHISERAIEESATNLIPEGSILIVTRSGILKHTLPVAVNAVEVAINQDIKALLISDRLLPEFVLVQLKVLSHLLLSKVRIGATVHNIETEELRRLKLIVPTLEEQQRFIQRLNVANSIQQEITRSANNSDELNQTLVAKAFTGELTQTWREAHREELETWLREHAECLPKKLTRISIKEIAPPERPVPARPARRWLMDQLSGVQAHVYKALQEWKGTLIPSEDLDSFLEEWPVEHLEDAHDHVLRALNQLAGLGLIARVSVPNQAGDYATAYRALREEDLTRAGDLKRLEASS